MILYVSGTVYADETIKHGSAYARATFNSLDNIEISTEENQLHFRFTSPFKTDSIDSTLTSLVTDHSNVNWELSVK